MADCGEYVLRRYLKVRTMRSLTVLAVLVSVLAMVLAAPKRGNDRFDPNGLDCGPYGERLPDGTCQCARHFHGERCDGYHSRRCTKDDDCGSSHAYCMHKMTIQCRLSAHCKDPSGWCVPLDL